MSCVVSRSKRNDMESCEGLVYYTIWAEVYNDGSSDMTRKLLGKRAWPVEKTTPFSHHPYDVFTSFFPLDG